MAIDGVPWFPGQDGARVSAHMARTLAYYAAGARDGVGGATDLKVQAMGTPGGSVRVAPGAVAALVRAAGHGQQSFIARNATETVVPVAANVGGSARSDLIAAIMRDPTVPGSGGTVPADTAVGPYWELKVVSGVGAAVTRLQEVSGYATISGVALARVTVPAATSAITEAMITDLRELSDARRKVEPLMASSTGEMNTNPNPQFHTEFVKWPSVAEWDVLIPDWATHVSVIATLYGVSFHTGDVWGEIRVALDTVTSPVSNYDVNWSGNPERVSFGLGARLAIPPAMRGTVKKARFEAKKTNGPGQLIAGRGTTTVLQMTFEENVL